MILDVVKLAIGADTHNDRQKRKMLESDAAMLHAQKWLMQKLSIKQLCIKRQRMERRIRFDFVSLPFYC